MEISQNFVAFSENRSRALKSQLFLQLRYFETAQDIYYKKQLPSYAISTYARFFEDTMIA